jgi:hypothetical protein
MKTFACLAKINFSLTEIFISTNCQTNTEEDSNQQYLLKWIPVVQILEETRLRREYFGLVLSG